MKEYRIIPGFEQYSVSNDGEVIDSASKVVSQWYTWDGYRYVDLLVGDELKMQRVHRLVGFAWVDNPDPEKYTIINHLDGTRTNNHYLNLEWTDYSGNNYHAVNTGLRSDPIAAYVRDFYTGEVKEFPSTAQACEYMGLRKDAAPEQYYPKMFGKLVKGKYEFRYKGDSTPWFYEDRPLMLPTRYLVLVMDSDGIAVEIASRKALYKKYQLYRCPQTDIPSIVEFGQALYPHLRFILRDSYTEPRFEADRIGDKSYPQEVVASKDGEELFFSSITKCAEHFEVDRSVIQARLNTELQYDGWTLVSMARSDGDI